MRGVLQVGDPFVALFFVATVQDALFMTVMFPYIETDKQAQGNTIRFNI